ncbi:hypothetical protein N9915_02215 [Akkermansiaceae bacterium]|nr:hypothetical protein [Akkermansiaceae bacterium]
MSLFSRQSPFEESRITWLFEAYTWLLANYGGYDSFLRSYHLVLNDPKDFKIPSPHDPKYVSRVFRTIMKNMGMGTWEVRLIPMSQADSDLEFEIDSSELSMGYSSDGAAGFFTLNEYREAIIGYGDHLVPQFTSLVTTLSHEASHYLITKSITVMPGGWKNLEPVTDLTAIFTGFGIFQCNDASIVSHSQEGQRTHLSGYLPESARAYALAIFSELSMLESKFVAKQLRPNPRSFFKAAIKDIRKNRSRDLSNLESVAPLRSW